MNLRPSWSGFLVTDESDDLRRWLIAGLLVCAAHAAGIGAGLLWQKPRTAAGDAPPAIMVELSPLAVAPDPTPLDIAPGPLMIEAKPEPKPLPKPEEVIPELLKKNEAEVVLPERASDQPPEKPKELQKHQAPQTTAPPKLKLKRADTMAAPAAGSTEDSAFANSNWRGAVVAHLNRFKRFPSGATSGIAVVAFSIDAGGRVTSAQLIRSSGSSALDADAVAMVWRASPVPTPPPSVSRSGAISLSVPVRYIR